MRIAISTLLFSAAFSYCISVRADTLNPIFINDTGGEVTDLHVNIVPGGVKITNPPGNDRAGTGIDSERHNWWGLTLKNGDQVAPKFETDPGVRIKIAAWWWTTGGHGDPDGTDGERVGDIKYQSDLKLSFAPAPATGDGAVSIHIFGQDYIFSTGAGASASDSTSLLSDFLQGLHLADGQPYFYLPRAENNSVEFLGLILDGDPTYATILRQDSGQVMTLEDLTVPEPASLYLTAFWLTILAAPIVIRRTSI